MLSVLTALCIIFSCSCSKFQHTYEPLGDGLEVTVLDVKQGDSIFIELPKERCMLIDAGENEYSKTVTDYISSKGFKKIDYLVGTHPHADHIGGMRKVIKKFDIGKIYMPRATANTKTFEKTLELIDDKGLSVTVAKAGVSILKEDDLSIDILAPNSDEYDELNNYSAVIKITYGATKFLFMGDAQTQSEREIRADVSADFIKVGHHGSKTSSGEEFVRRVGAKYAAVSVAEENDYNLPVEKIIDRWKNSGAQVLMTKDVGNIVAYSDGASLTVNGVKAEAGTTADYNKNNLQPNETPDGKWVLNTNTKRIHSNECPLIENIAKQNIKYSDESISELKKQGYKTCGSCKPTD